MLEKTGVPTADDLQKVSPAPQRLAQGPVAVVECFQRIPCDPCFTACKKGAIKPFADINDLPEFDADRCDGCGLCISACPGLAIFVIHENYGATESLVKLPYEFLPVPQPGDTVQGLDREGQFVANARVVRVQDAPFRDKTLIVWLAVPKGTAMTVRHFRMGER